MHKKIILYSIIAVALCWQLGSCGNYDDDINRLDGISSDLASSISTLDKSDKEIKGLVDALGRKSEDIKATLESIDSQLAGGGDNAELEEIRSELESLKSDFEAQIGGINNSISDLRKKDDELLSLLSSIRSDLKNEISQERAKEIEKAVKELETSVKDYISGLLAKSYITKDEVNKSLGKYLSKTELETFFKDYYTKGEVDVRLMTIEYVPEYADGVVRVPYRVKDGKYSPESFSMTFETSYSESLKDVVAVERVRAVYAKVELTDSEELGAAVLDVVQTEFPSDGVFRVTVFPKNLDASFFYGKRSATMTVSLDVNGRKVLLGSYQMIPEDADRKSDVRTFKVGDASFRMIRVRAGSFLMGGEDDTAIYDNGTSKPKHNVKLTRDYWIAETELTRAVYRAVMGEADGWLAEWWSSTLKKDDSSLPADALSWNMANAFIGKLNSLTGEKFRFPTEAEWEFAARGGLESDGFVYYAGSDSADDVGWADIGDYVYPVGLRKPNESGLYDMCGNAEEWCSDWYGAYSSDDQTDPAGPATGEYKVCRGGNVWISEVGCYVFSRHYFPVDWPSPIEDSFYPTTVRLTLSVPEGM